MASNNRYFTLVLFLSSSHLFVDGFGEYFKRKVTSGLSRLASPFKKTEKNIPIDDTWPDIMKDLTNSVNSCSGDECQKNLLSLQQLESLVLTGKDEATVDINGSRRTINLKSLDTKEKNALMEFISTQYKRLVNLMGRAKRFVFRILGIGTKENKNPVQSGSEKKGENEDKSTEVLSKASKQKENPGYAIGRKEAAQADSPKYPHKPPAAGTASNQDPLKQVKLEPESKRDGEHSSTDGKPAASGSAEPDEGISAKLQALEPKIPVNPNRERAAVPIKEFWDENWKECNSGEVGKIIAATQSRNKEEK